jgi:hypothetical protein
VSPIDLGTSLRELDVCSTVEAYRERLIRVPPYPTLVGWVSHMILVSCG